MRMKSQYWFVIVVGGAVALYFIVRSIFSAGQPNLDASKAAVRQGEIALAQVNIKAPSAGVCAHRDAEVGSFLAPGQRCGTMIEIDPLLIVGAVPETRAASLKVGAPAAARLVS